MIVIMTTSKKLTTLIMTANNKLIIVIITTSKKLKTMITTKQQVLKNFAICFKTPSKKNHFITTKPSKNKCANRTKSLNRILKWI